MTLTATVQLKELYITQLFFLVYILVFKIIINYKFKKNISQNNLKIKKASHQYISFTEMGYNMSTAEIFYLKQE